MSQAEVDFYRAETSVTKNEVEKLHQQMMEMELCHAEQIDDHMKRNNEVTVSEEIINRNFYFSFFFTAQVNGS